MSSFLSNMGSSGVKSSVKPIPLPIQELGDTKNIEYIKDTKHTQKADTKDTLNTHNRIIEGVEVVENAKRALTGGRIRTDKKAEIEKVMAKPKERRQKPTQLMIKTAQNLVETGGVMAPAMRKAGYSAVTANNPHKLSKSKAFQGLCADMGLSKELVVGSLRDDIEAKPGFRVQELKLASKILGIVKPASTNISVNVAHVELDNGRKSDIVDIM